MYLFCISCKYIVATIKVPTLVVCWFVRYLDSSGYAGFQHHFYDEQKNKLIQIWFVASLVSSYLVFTYLVFWFISYLDSSGYAGLQHCFSAEQKNKLIQINEQMSQNAFNLSYF